MATLPTSFEEAFSQEIDGIANNDDIQFAKKHYLFIDKHRCQNQDKSAEVCIDSGRQLFQTFDHGLKLAKMNAFYCMGKCSEDSCYSTCKENLSKRVQELYNPLRNSLDDYLLKFAS